jgi:hypothetical protein
MLFILVQVVEETGLKQRLAPGHPYLEGEVVYCLRVSHGHMREARGTGWHSC